MFKNQVTPLDELLRKFIRDEGLETPLLQQRAIDAWNTVTGAAVQRYTGEKFIRNQILFVKITSPSLRQDLSMMHTQLTRRINEAVGSSIITDVRVY